MKVVFNKKPKAGQELNKVNTLGCIALEVGLKEVGNKVGTRTRKWERSGKQTNWETRTLKWGQEWEQQNGRQNKVEQEPSKVWTRMGTRTVGTKWEQEP